MGRETRERVGAFIVTYRRPEVLRENLAALQAQTRRLDGVVVINNDPGHDVRGVVRRDFPDVEVVDLAENVGSAGGFACALFIANRCHYTWAWLLDDDAIPEPSALDELLRISVRLRQDGRPVNLLAPVQVSPAGTFGGALWRNRVVAVPPAWRTGTEPFKIDLAYWAGLLAHRDVVNAIGFPRSDFFRCYGDYEYCLRARSVGMEIVAVPTSRVAHHEGLSRAVVRWGRRSVRSGYPPSRYYYDARNATFTAWHTMRSPLAVVFQLVRQARLAVGDLFYEDQKLRRVRLRFEGAADGLSGRLGRRPGLE